MEDALTTSATGQVTIEPRIRRPLPAPARIAIVEALASALVEEYLSSVNSHPNQRTA